MRTEITDTAGTVRVFTSRYAQDEVTTAALAQQLTADRAAEGAASAAAAAGRRSLGLAALDAYTDAGTAGPSGSDPLEPEVGATYLQVAVGDVTDTIDRYRLQRRQLAGAEQTLASDEVAAVRAQSAAGATRTAALTQAAASETQLEGLQARLVSLEDAAQAQAAAAASTRSAAAVSATVTQGGPVRHGLVDAVVQVVAPAPPPAPSVATAPAAAPGTVPTGAAPTAAAPTTTPPTTVPVHATPSPTPSAGPSGGAWLQLRECESGDDYQADTGNGYYGAYQFSAQTWTGLGYPGRPDQEPPSMQDAAAERLQAASGWSQWPACAAALGLT